MIEPTRDPEFQIARSMAIEAYANLENSLAYVFGLCLGAPQDRASVVFFRIINSRSRNTIISDLLEKAYGSHFDIYWHGQPGESGKKKIPGLLGHVRSLDDARNEIVHWHAVLNWGRDDVTGERTCSEDLRPHTYWSKLTEVVPITKDGLRAFRERADFTGASIWMFYKVMANWNVSDSNKETWLQIFQQPVPYPPSDSHPLSPNYKAPESPPQSSEA